MSENELQNEKEQIEEIIKQSNLEYKQMGNNTRSFSIIKLIAFIIMIVFIILTINTIRKTNNITDNNKVETIHIKIDNEGNITNTIIEQENTGE